MTIYQRMAAIFAAVQVPGFLIEWKATEAYPNIPDTYCAYLVELDGEALAADDREIMHHSRVWIDLYGERDVSEALGRLRAALIADGFYISPARDLDNPGMRRHQYHRRLRADHYEDV